MEKIKRTRGTWKAYLEQTQEIGLHKAFEVYRPTDDKDLGEWIAKVRGNNQEELIANTKLLAAAPDLLEALQELVGIVEGIMDGSYDADSFTLQPAKKAIDKATL